MTTVASSSGKKQIWIRTDDKTTITTALECGLTSTLLLNSDNAKILTEWKQLGRIQAILPQPDGSLIDENTGSQVGTLQIIKNANDLATVESTASSLPGFVVMDASDWQIIPAENLVATFQSLPNTSLLAVAKTAAESQTMLGALEIGVDGVVLETNDPIEVRTLATFLQDHAAQQQQLLNYEIATVTAVKPAAVSCDRACVDLCMNMAPGEGLLTGNFAAGMFLVHSECEESGYINSRPFRVNAGAVHAYVQVPGGLTRYLAELRSGDEVQIADAHGKIRPAVVGRVKIEKRPLVLVEASTENGRNYSIFLQNAETVKLVGPVEEGGKSGGKMWRAISVAQLREHDKMYVLVQSGARHTGIKIDESITER